MKQRRPTTNTSNMRILTTLRTPLKRVEHTTCTLHLKSSELNILAREASLSWLLAALRDLRVWIGGVMMCIAVPTSRTHRPAVYHRCPSHINRVYAFGKIVQHKHHANSFVASMCHVCYLCSVWKRAPRRPFWH